mmetsp:Transcript_7653/g.30307  ORF Transcript_7653/g.30307 Transcript_7653/m.30307 type:complete len:211 (-) Transcript_7653:6-638(-)
MRAARGGLSCSADEGLGRDVPGDQGHGHGAQGVHGELVHSARCLGRNGGHQVRSLFVRRSHHHHPVEQLRSSEAAERPAPQVLVRVHVPQLAHGQRGGVGPAAGEGQRRAEGVAASGGNGIRRRARGARRGRDHAHGRLKGRRCGLGGLGVGHEGLAPLESREDDSCKLGARVARGRRVQCTGRRAHSRAGVGHNRRHESCQAGAAGAGP